MNQKNHGRGADDLHHWCGLTLPPLLTLGIVVAGWQMLVDLLGLQPYILPGPAHVSEAIATNLDSLIRAVSLTAQAAIAGFLLSFVAGFFIAVLFSQSAWVERSLYPYAIFLQTVPIVAVAPLIVMWIGHGLGGIIAVSFIISLFPIIANTTAGLTSISPPLDDLFALHDASRWQRLWKLQVPHAVPDMLTGARISCGLSVIGAIVGEFFTGYGTTDFGLGYLIIQTNAMTKTPYLFACVLFSTGLGLLFFGVVSTLNRLILRRWAAAR